MKVIAVDVPNDDDETTANDDVTTSTTNDDKAPASSSTATEEVTTPSPSPSPLPLPLPSSSPLLPPPLPGFTDEYLQSMNQVLAQQSLSSVLEWCFNSLPSLFQITSFGSTGMVVIHEMHKLNLKIPVIFLDTLYHFEETLEHAKSVEKQYDLEVHWYRCSSASTREEFEKEFKSNDMWISHPRRYEYLTKVEPLERSLAEHKVGAWITGRRRDQGGLRSELPILELDVDGRIKVNPLAHWTREEVWGYLRKEGVPYNPLFDRSYASIGDSVTTAKTDDVSTGERAGRFYQFDGKKTECGIHIRRAYTDSSRPSEASPN